MENARSPIAEKPSAPNSADSTCTDRLTPRQRRVIVAMLQAPGWLSRETIDRVAGASNGPQVIRQLRRKLTGPDGIETERTPMLDRDGRLCKPGRYRLTLSGRERLAALTLPDYG